MSSLPAVATQRVSDLAFVLALVLFAFAAYRLSWPLARRLVLLSRFSHRARDQRPERAATLQGIVADLVSLLAVSVAVVAALVRLFHVDADTIVWTVGLFSVAFGLSARPILSDLFAGMSLVVGDIYAVGEKVNVAGVEGVVEEVTLRTTRLRSDSGELFVVPNGEVRVVRNFARSSFSVASIRVTVASGNLQTALEVLQELGATAAERLPDLEPPLQIVSETGAIAASTTLTLVAHARFGRGAALRPELLALVNEAFAARGIALVE
jgi:small conductance mechanosensitive channel